MKITVSLWMSLFFTSLVFGHKLPEAKSGTIHFTKNENQWDARILYKANLDGGSLFLENDGFTYHLYDKEKRKEQHLQQLNPNHTISDNRIRSHAYKMQFKNVVPQQAPAIEALYPGTDYTNYFIGNDPKKWADHVRSFQQLHYKELYPKIDLEIIGQENSVKYNFIVAPHGDPAAIVMEYKGVQAPFLKEGRLVIKNSLNDIIEERPFAYQQVNGKNVKVPCQFVVKNQEVTFSFEKGYNPDLPLIIDPTLIFCSYSGSTADNFGMTATYDSHGNLYAGGTAFDMGYPTTLGAFDTVYNGIVAYGRTDVVITKYDSTGSKLLYSTYIGGASGSEIVTSLIVNGQDELYLYGATGSSDFPTTTNAFSRSFKGGDTLRFMFNGTYFDQGTDIYVAKLNQTGTQLLASTYIGGSKNDGVNHNNSKSTIYYNCPSGVCSINEYKTDSIQYNYGDQYRGEIMLDLAGNCYIASSTRSPDFPIVNGFDKTLSGQQDAVVLKFKPDLSALYWSSYLGGNDNDAGNAIAVDDAANVYVTGGTRSKNFPTTSTALNPVYLGGKADGFITKISSNGTAILASTFIGTAAYDQSYFVQLDKRNNVYLFGQTGGNFPVSAGVYSNLNGGQFIIKLNNSLSQVAYATVFGNGNGVNISPSAFLVDYCENVYISGWGGDIIYGPPTFNMPLTADAFQKTNPDGFNFYLMVLSKDVKKLVYATYFGGPQSLEHVDGGTSRFDKKGIIYQSVCAGCGRHSDLPTTPGAWSRINKSNNCNNGTFKMDFGFKLVASNFLSTQQGCSPLRIDFKNVSTSKTHFLWDFGNNDTTSKIVNPSRTYNQAGQYQAKLIVIDSSTCNGADTSFKYITVFPNIQHQTVSNTSTLCSYSCDGTASIQVKGGTPPFTYTWSNGGNSTTLKNLCPGNYTVLIRDSLNCQDTASTFIKSPPVLISTISFTNNLCKNPCIGAASIKASGGTSPYTFSWSTGLQGPSINGLCKGNYTVNILDFNKCKNSTAFSISDTQALALQVQKVQAYCNGLCNGSISAMVSGGRQPYTYIWNNNSKAASLSNICSGVYSLKIADANLCKDSLKIVLTDSVRLSSKTDKTPSPCGKTCLAQASVSVAGGTGPYSYQWNDKLLQKTQIATSLCNGNYQVRIADAKGCRLKDSVAIFYPLGFPLVRASVDKDTLYEGQSTYVHANQGIKYLYLWSPATGLSSTTETSPLASPLLTTTYKVTVKDSIGCESRDSVTIHLKRITCSDPEIFIPNGFSPNEDGMNDILFVRGRTIEEMYLAVYDRWGEKMFESTSPQSGWDGRYKGALVTPAVYAYYLRVRCFNKKEYFKKGNITVIR